MALKCRRIAPWESSALVLSPNAWVRAGKASPCTASALHQPQGLPLGTPREVTQLEVSTFGEGFLALPSFQLQ